MKPVQGSGVSKFADARRRIASSTGEVALKACPFCAGSDFAEHYDRIKGRYEVHCSTCGTNLFRDTQDAAREAWNTRSSGWQDISTAPKDGTEVLLFTNRVEVGSWCGCGAYRPKTKERPAYFEKAWGSAGTKFSPQPKFWMPLPSSPSGERV